ncbi:MAG: GAF domain-containing protein [Silvanigrellales bacterium]|nr:GAF domain-containing protein [Silvanigrellales bacterium]
MKEKNLTVVTLQDRLESLFEVGRLLATYDDLDSLLSRILGEVHEVMQANAASMLLRVPGTDLLEFVNTRGSVAEHIQTRRLRIGEGISGEVARTRSIINVPDAYSDPRFNDSFDKSSGFVTKQILAAPMVFRDTVVGVISVMNRRNGGAFDADDERILSIFSDQASIAVINAQEKRKYEQKNRALTVFAREIGRILSSELTLVYGYIHQTRRFLAKSLGEEHAWLVDKVNVPLAAVERSTDSLVRISKTLGVFTRSTENVNSEIISVNEALGYFLRETKYHRVHVYVEGRCDVKMRLPLESLFLVLESLLESLVAPLPKGADFHGRLFLVFRERVDHADFRICATQDLVTELQSRQPTQADAQSLLSLATIESIVDSFDAELLDAVQLASARTQESLLSNARPFRATTREAASAEGKVEGLRGNQAGGSSSRAQESEETHPNQLVLVRWQLAIPLSDAEVPRSRA